MMCKGRCWGLVRRIMVLLGAGGKNEEGNREEAKNIPWASVRELQQVNFVTVGRHTYGLAMSSVIRPTQEAPVTIGSFCSFAPGVIILAHADHPTSLVSTFPFRTLFCNLRSVAFDPLWSNQDAVTRGAVNIGHDVWVGQNAIILSGVTVGNGAIIGAGAVVTKDVPPYAIVVGNPATISRYRFSPEIIRGLEKIQWWNFPDEQIESWLPIFYSTPDELINRLLNNGVR